MTPADRRLLRARLDVALWPIPAVLTVLAAVLAELVSRIPTDTAQTLLVLPDFGPSTALAVLSAIATGMLTFTGLVAAVILLALQFGASQLSPRLLRTLVGRSPAKWALGVSIAAFVYSLLVIGEVSPQGSSASVPGAGRRDRDRAGDRRHRRVAVPAARDHAGAARRPGRHRGRPQGHDGDRARPTPMPAEDATGDRRRRCRTAPRQSWRGTATRA